MAEDGLGPEEPLLEERAPGGEVSFGGEAIGEGGRCLDAGDGDSGGWRRGYGE